MSSRFFIVRYKINKLKAAAADRRQWGRVINETIVNKRKIIYINGGIYNGRAYLTFTWRGKLVFVFAFVRGACLRCLPRPSPVHRLQGTSRGGRCGVVVWVVHRRSDRRTDVIIIIIVNRNLITDIILFSAKYLYNTTVELPINNINIILITILIGSGNYIVFLRHSPPPQSISVSLYLSRYF